MANCSTSGNIYLHPNISYSPLNVYLSCFKSREEILIYFTFITTVALLLLPLCAFIFYLGLQKWRRVHSLNNTDFFTINFAAMKLIVYFGHSLFFCGIYFEQVKMTEAGYGFWAISWHGENLFHFLTCTERYLAVVHPIIYMNLRSQQWKRIRNITIGCVWLMSFGVTSLTLLTTIAQILDFFLLVSSLILLMFLNVSVLCILIRSGPGKQGKNKNRLDQSKQRALYFILAILGVLILRFVWKFVWLIYEIITRRHECVFFIYGVWADFPSALVLPLLFLNKTDTVKLCLHCKKNSPED